MPSSTRYDAGNRVTGTISARFASQSGEGVANAYDGFGRLASSSTNMGGVTRTLGYTWDAAGNRLTIAHPDGVWFGAQYDGLNRRNYLHANNSLALIQTFHAPHGAPSAVGRPYMELPAPLPGGSGDGAGATCGGIIAGGGI